MFVNVKYEMFYRLLQFIEFFKVHTLTHAYTQIVATHMSRVPGTYTGYCRSTWIKWATLFCTHHCPFGLHRGCPRVHDHPRLPDHFVRGCPTTPRVPNHLAQRCPTLPDHFN